MGAYRKNLSYNGPAEIQEDHDKEDESKNMHAAILSGKHGSAKKWCTGQKPNGTYQGMYAKVLRLQHLFQQ
jgi:hypothetical protein